MVIHWGVVVIELQRRGHGAKLIISEKKGNDTWHVLNRLSTALSSDQHLFRVEILPGNKVNTQFPAQEYKKTFNLKLSKMLN